jgi:hypothetical protein
VGGGGGWGGGVWSFDFVWSSPFGIPMGIKLEHH